MRLTAALGVLALVLARPGTVSAAGQPDAPGPAGIVFVGSSIFHRWTSLQTQMAPLPIVNLAFDGAQTDDMLRLVDSRVVPMRPKVVAYYCGSNDVDAGESATAIVDRIRQFIDRVAAALPDTRVVFVSINRAPEKQGRWDVVDAVNHQIEMYAAKNKHVEYADVNLVLFDQAGMPRLEFFMSDRLHLRPQAYQEFARVLKPVLTKALTAPSLR
jgi:lysophospholipase L1-like esterase